jgi:hypothetical protein
MVVQKSPVFGFLGALGRGASISTACGAPTTDVLGLSGRSRRRAPAVAVTARGASALAPSPDTMSTAGPAPACPPRPADGGRRPAGRSRGSSRAPAEDVQPRRRGDQRGPYRWRPQHVPASGQAPIQRSTTSSASMRWARSAFSLAAPALISTPRVRTPNAPVLTIRQTSGPRGYCRRARKAHRTRSARERSARRRTRA